MRFPQTSSLIRTHIVLDLTPSCLGVFWSFLCVEDYSVLMLWWKGWNINLYHLLRIYTLYLWLPVLFSLLFFNKSVFSAWCCHVTFPRTSVRSCDFMLSCDFSFSAESGGGAGRRRRALNTFLPWGISAFHSLVTADFYIAMEAPQLLRWSLTPPGCCFQLGLCFFLSGNLAWHKIKPFNINLGMSVMSSKISIFPIVLYMFPINFLTFWIFCSC